MELQAKNISKRYFRKLGDRNNFSAVEPASLILRPGQLTVLMGRSGSGKTTLLSILAGLLTPDTGEVLADGQALYQMNDRDLSAFRARHIAVAPQGRAVPDALNIYQNTLFTAQLADLAGSETEARAMDLLDLFGISDLRDAYPRELSGGELRRVMLARALLPRPDILLCDEPTGDLDDKNTVLVLDTLHHYAAEGHTVLLVTHETDAIRHADRLLHMDAGTLTEEELQSGDNC